MKQTIYLSLLLILCVTTVASCGGPECGPQTKLENNKCVPVISQEPFPTTPAKDASSSQEKKIDGSSPEEKVPEETQDSNPSEQPLCACQNGKTRPCYEGTDGTQNKGLCKAGTQSCKKCQWDKCEGQVIPQVETCDGKDNDCDGNIDNLTGTADALTRFCYSGNQQTKDKGSCQQGLESCSEGKWTGTCKGEVIPQEEICDGKDNDCDGQVDEGSTSGKALERSCYTGDSTTRKQGECKDGSQICEQGKWSQSCKAEVKPTQEICDGKDNDCNGKVDEVCNCKPNETQPCYPGAKGTENKGSCKAGSQTCDQNGAWGECKGATTPQIDLCDGQDNDCDGKVDNQAGTASPLSRACYTGATGTQGKGECRGGIELCQSGKWLGVCIGGVIPTAEICDGKDNDCNGLIDDPAQGQGQVLTRACYSGPKGTQGKGVCKAGAQSCKNGQWDVCAGEVLPKAEVCDQTDNNCDGQVDENIGTCKCGNGRLDPGEDCDGSLLNNETCQSQNHLSGTLSCTKTCKFDINQCKPKPEWTILVYLSADNDLEIFGMQDFNEMEVIGSTKDVQIVVQIDRHAAHDTSDGNWTDARRYFVTKDNNTKTIGSKLIASLGEVSMDDPKVLESFLTWGIKKYPAKKYALIMWNHGNGWLGMASDDTSQSTDPNKLMNIDGFSAALARVRSTTGLSKFELVGFDMCLMGMLEVDVALAQHAKYRVASQELEKGFGWNYSSILQVLTAKPGMDGKELALAIVKDYSDFYTRIVVDPDYTMSAVDLSNIPQLFLATHRFGTQASLNAKTIWPALGKASLFAENFRPTGGGPTSVFKNTSYVDLSHFLDVLEFVDTSKTLASQIAGIRSAMNGIIFAEKHGPNHSRATGISSFMPSAPDPINLPFYLRTSHGASGWGLMVKAYLLEAVNSKAPVLSNVQPDKTLLDHGGQAIVSLDIDAKGLVGVLLEVVLKRSSDELSLSMTNLSVPSKTMKDGTKVPDLADGKYSYRLGVGTRVPLISDGQQSWFAPAQVRVYGSNKAVMYASAELTDGTNKATGFLKFVYDATLNKGSLTSFVSTTNKEYPLQNVSASAGMTFRLLYTNKATGKTTLKSDPFSVGKAPITISYDNLNYGQYDFYITPFTVAGKSDSKKITMTIGCQNNTTSCRANDPDIYLCTNNQWSKRSCHQVCTSAGYPGSDSCSRATPTSRYLCQCKPCTNGAKRCVGNVLSTCVQGAWQDKTCRYGCDTNQCLYGIRVVSASIPCQDGSCSSWDIFSGNPDPFIRITTPGGKNYDTPSISDTCGTMSTSNLATWNNSNAFTGYPLSLVNKFTFSVYDEDISSHDLIQSWTIPSPGSWLLQQTLCGKKIELSIVIEN